MGKRDVLVADGDPQIYSRPVTSSVDPTTGEKSAKVLVVGQAQFPVYKTLDAAYLAEGKGDVEAGKKIVLELFNTQNATNIANTIRSSATQPISRDKIRDELIDDGSLFDNDEFMAAKGDKPRQTAILEKLIDARIATKKAAIIAQTKTEEADAGEV